MPTPRDSGSDRDPALPSDETSADASTETPAAEPAPDPATEAAVRSLLSEAGATTEAMPADVRARMETTIADLATAPRTASAGTAAGPAPLASRRRRRVVQGLLAAAAAVVVVGIGLQYSDGTDGDMLSAADSEPERGEAAAEADSAGTADMGTEDMGTEELDGGLEAQSDSASRSTAPKSTTDGAEAGGGVTSQLDRDRAGRRTTLRDVERTTVEGPLPRLGQRHLREDLIELRDSSLPHPATADYTRTTLRAPRGFTCSSMRPGTGKLVAARYAGSPVVVAFREPMGSTQVADVVQCGTGDTLRSVTIPTAE